MRITLLLLLAFPTVVLAQLQVGVAKVDVSPTFPVRLSGYAARQTASEGVEHPLHARALAIGTSKADAAVLVALDNTAVPLWMTDDLAKRLKAKAGVPRERVVLTCTHTHAAPCLTGALVNIFGKPISADEQANIDRYTKETLDKVERAALAALEDLKPATLSLVRGQVGFAANRRKPAADGTPGPVDRELAVLVARAPDGAVRAAVANYACHCTTTGGNVNKAHGDWAGFAAATIEKDFPAATALVTIGCGADANPHPRGTLDLVRQHGQSLATEFKRVASTPAKTTLTTAPAGRLKTIDLLYDRVPTRDELEQAAKEQTAAGHNARTQLDRLAKDGKLPTSLPYTVQTWTFGDDLAMVFLAGEVVVDYSIRLKRELSADKLWITAYANDVPCYIPSRRILVEGGYEPDTSMIYYGRPGRLAPRVEDDVVSAVRDLLPPSFRAEP